MYFLTRKEKVMTEDKKNRLNSARKRKFSITTIITLVSIIITCLVAVIVTYYSVTNNKTVVEKETKKMLESSSKGYAKDLDTQFLIFKTSVDSIANYIKVNYDVNSSGNDAYNDQFISELSKYISVVSTSDENILGVWSFMDTNKTSNLEYAWFEGGSPRDIGDRSTEYAKYKENDESAVFNFAHQTESLKTPEWQNPRFDDGLGCYTVTYAYPVFIGDYYYGMVGVGLKLESIESLVKSIKLYKTGQAIIVDNYGNFLVHDKYDINSNIADSEYADIANSQSAEGIIMISMCMVIRCLMGIRYTWKCR
jgi:sensor domain CHASE-containing protein